MSVTIEQQLQYQDALVDMLDFCYRNCILHQGTLLSLQDAKRSYVYSNPNWSKLSKNRKKAIHTVDRFLFSQLQRDWLVWAYNFDGKILEGWDNLNEEERAEIRAGKVKGAHYWVKVVTPAFPVPPVNPSPAWCVRFGGKLLSYELTSKVFHDRKD